MTRLRLCLPFLPVLFISLLPTHATAQSGGKFTGIMHVSVQVRLPDGSSAPSGVLVELELQDTEMVTQEQTDSAGKCAFHPGSPAIYLVRAKQAGYYDAVVAVDLQNTPNGMANLVLRPVPGEAAEQTSKEVKGGSVSAADLGVPPPARKEFDLGRQAIENRDLDGGIAHLRRAIGIQENFPQAYTLMGMVYNEQKQWKDGQAALEKAVQQNPKAAEAYVYLGSSLLQQRDLTGAEKALNRGLQLNPDVQDSPMAHYTLATAYFADGQWKDAEPHTAKAIAAHPEFAPAHWLMAQIMLKKGDGQNAVQEFQTYLRLDPDGPSASAVRAAIPRIQAAIEK